MVFQSNVTTGVNSNFENSTLITEDERKVFADQILSDFAYVFGEIEATPSPRIPEFEINLKPGAQPFRVKPYRLSPQYIPFLKKEIEDLLRKDIIRPSRSPFCSNVWVVPKKGKNGTTYLN